MNNPESSSFLKQEEKEFARRYRVSLWWVEHRLLLKRLGLSVLMAANAALFLFVAWSFLDAFAVSFDAEQGIVARMVAVGQTDLRAYTRARAAQPLEAEPVRVIASGADRFDFVTLVTNANADWFARFTYHFSSSVGDTPLQQGFILPGEKKPVLHLSFEAPGAVRDASLVFDEMHWQHVDKKVVPDYETFAAERLRFDIRDVNYSTEIAVNAARLGRVEFTVENTSAYSYWEPVFVALLKRGDAIVGINRVVLETLASGETRAVVMHWFGPLPSVSRVEIVPEINILNRAAYKPL